MRKNILNIVAFCILMENNGGIVDKSIDYIIEKFLRYCANEEDEWLWGLDDENYKKLKTWAKKWLYVDLDKVIEEWAKIETDRLTEKAKAEPKARAEEEIG